VTGSRVAVVRRVLPAPPNVVFDEWLDPVGMTEWMCPRPARAVKIALEPSVGGSLRIDIEDSGVSLYVTGRFTELDRPRRLRFTWSCSDWADPSVQSEVTVLLEDHGPDQTLMTIEHEQLPPEQVDGHERGWDAVAGQLGEALGARGCCPAARGHAPRSVRDK
jgi:uncharacterized protein YndB with AHSA1/START domain